MAYKIKKIKGLEILDSRGNPTVMATVELDSGVKGRACVPSGASTGTYEALELRDGDKKRYGGKGVLKAVYHINSIINGKLLGRDVTKQKEIDKAMIKLDGTENKSRLGANAILAISLACARAGANALKLPLYAYLKETYNFSEKVALPKPMMNIINGGKHADSGLSFQEFLIIPQKDKFVENLRLGAEVFHCLAEVLKVRGLSTLVGDEGGYAPKLTNHKEAPELIIEAIKNAGYITKKDIMLGLDAAATEFYNAKEKNYMLSLEHTALSDDQMIGLYEEWSKKYGFVSFEDPLAEDDWQGWQKITEKFGHEYMLIGDDIFVTNTKRFLKGVKAKVANAILIKVNQIGTLSETIDCIKLAQKHGYKVIIAHRSGETCNSFIADLAVACSAEYIKAGSASRGERLAKYNRLLEIEAEIKPNYDK